ncbi:hypothetical protein D9613_001264 [Agrocybe pediades]|uniref:Uncharacterized protein n=1 Tax=Agrocybe pediades TaxID=84607 RepID=A0A8H4QZC8_9AGAR|nr:hypothetical protein D9613_001264 [Agrocybe pediades]
MWPLSDTSSSPLLLYHAITSSEPQLNMTSVVQKGASNDILNPSVCHYTYLS